jgi:hypothetical protein
MPYGCLNRKQKLVVKALVRGKKVHDLGCGDHVLSNELLKMGAQEVIAIDAHPYGVPLLMRIDRAVTPIKAHFEAYALTQPEIEIAFVSWPANRADRGLLALVSSAKKIVYLGKCTDGTCCGWPALFDHFLHRELLKYEPDVYNTLCIYGDDLDTPREGELEERAGLDWTRIHTAMADGVVVPLL